MIEFAGEEVTDPQAQYEILRATTDAAKYRIPDARGFKKWDHGKPDPSLIPPGAIMDVAAVLSHGADKYGANNWHKCANSRRYVAAALRHIFAWIGGEEVDAESGLPHLAHATTCLLFLAEFPKLARGARPFSERFAGEDDPSPADLMPATPEF